MEYLDLSNFSFIFFSFFLLKFAFLKKGRNVGTKMNENDMYLMCLPAFSKWRIHRKEDRIKVLKSYKFNIKGVNFQLLGQYYNHYNIKIKAVLFFSASYCCFLSFKSLEKKMLRIYFNNFRSQEGHSKCKIDT